ncbi:hypothetical protein ATCV1_z262R [Acanthocystis turfacea chlorella virus 1]|uniref:Uncharacterized protein z262R n=1 Tax=Chlorovirus heliozoae TaxID=322019 RepID=A7K8M2_9PHYC|nr:hypothetical protein ATCV1_z262R [Acanthocystis turfacea chlorella virus 1]ABT16396.1 hypothetical protein ATCV1_z262R [Acanthocystis turfacea chlorella virus 1]
MNPLSHSGCVLRSCGRILGMFRGLTKFTTSSMSFTVPPGVPVRANTYMRFAYFCFTSSDLSHFTEAM